MSPILPAAAGAIGGAGICLIIASIWPAPARLDAALARLASPPPARPPQGGTAGRWLTSHLDRPGRLAIPRTDLAILGQTTEAYLVRKLTAAAAGLLSFALVGALAGLAGIRIPWEMPTVASIAAAAGMFVFVDVDIRANAARRRRDFIAAWISYLQLVRLNRAAGAGTTEALEHAARIGDGWSFGLINDVIDRARRAHEPPWKGLAQLGERIGVPEVSELADTVQIAGSEGTKIAATLTAKTESLRGYLQAGTRGKANSRTTTMIVPLSLLGLGFVILMAFPSFYALLFST